MRKYKIKTLNGTFTYEQIKERYPTISFPPEHQLTETMLLNIGIATIPPTLDELKQNLLTHIQEWTAKAITGGFESNYVDILVRFDSDLDTQITMQGIALNVNTAEFASEYPQGCPVRGYADGAPTKTIFMLNPNQVLQFCADLSKHIGKQKQHGWELQQAVAAAQTEEELKQIVW